MATIRDRADAARFYYTGADSDGGDQAEPDLSLGSFRSSTEVEGLVHDTDPAYGTVDYVAGYNGPGTGVITTTAPDQIQYTAPGGAIGPAVTIADGETHVVESNNPSKYIRFTRTQAAALPSDTDNIVLTDPANGVIGARDAVDADFNGGPLVRAVMMKNEHVSSSNITSLILFLGALGTYTSSVSSNLDNYGAGEIALDCSDWPESGWCLLIQTADGFPIEVVYYYARTDSKIYVGASGRGRMDTIPKDHTGLSMRAVPIPGMQLAIETPDADELSGDLTVGETYIPPDLVFTKPWGTAAWMFPISIGTMAKDDMIGIWFKLDMPPGVIGESDVLKHIRLNGID